MSRNFEDFMVIWVDSTLNIKHIYDYVVKESYDMRKIINYVKLFTNCDECYTYLTNIEMKNENIFLVISGTLGENFIPRIHSTIKEIFSIYIYCSYVEKHELWAKNYSKIKGVFKDILKVCEQIKYDTIQCSNNLIKINIGSTEEELLINYNKLLEKIELINNEENKKNLINICQDQYCDNEYQLEIVDAFFMEYHSDQSLLRYQQTHLFINRILRKALRVQDEYLLIHSLGFFIKDLHQQQQSQNNINIIDVYRGLAIEQELFEKFQEKKFFYVTNILSANKNRNNERNLAIEASQITEKIPVLLQIRTTVNNKEQEIVTFPLNIVFIIQQITQDKHSNVQIVHLIASSL